MRWINTEQCPVALAFQAVAPLSATRTGTLPIADKASNIIVKSIEILAMNTVCVGNHSHERSTFKNNYTIKNLI